MGVLDYIEANPGIFYAIFIVILVFNGLVFFLGGRKAEERFRNQTHQRIVFREKGASGHSKKSVITRFGGASKVLDVVVTDTELWIKGIWPMFSYIGTKCDLTHRVPLSSIKRIEPKGGKVEIWFENEERSESRVQLHLKDVPGFTAAVGS